MSNATTATLSPEQKRALLARLLKEKGAAGAATAGRPRDQPAHRLFEAQAARTPDAPAVTDGGGRTLSYRELDGAADALARRLRALGVGPATLVGLAVGRSAEMVVGLLAVLKAGGAYVPLDPHFPDARLAQMLGDAKVSVLLTTADLRDRLPAGDARVLCVDGPQEETPAAGLDAGGAGLDDRAYVIYTSGSTGTPKGVEVTHRNLANFLRGMAMLLKFAGSDALLAVTTLSFDIAGLELLLPLTVGARVAIAGRDEAMDGPRLARRLEADGITALQATPATWRLLLESGWPGKADLAMLCGGEALPRELADRLLALPHASLWNLYGPTETTIWSTAARVEPGEGPVPIGRPILNTQLYVLDQRLRPVPVGIAGELYIGGAGVARGYLNRPELTAERFVPDLFGAEPGGRLYRSGDLARWRPDGALECLGRVDHQVKVRGFRVELGEVESALNRHPAIADSAVTARDDASGEKALAAYIVPRDGVVPASAELRDWVGRTLPEYMVPATVTALAALPRTPNGKLDRKALPEPAASAAGSAAHVAPRGPIEEALAAAWAEVLGRGRVGVHDDFFDAGGHSLMAAQLLARVRTTFGVDVPLRDLFDAPTVAGLGRRVEDALRADAGVEVPPLVPVDRGDGSALPASFAQQRMWFLDQLEPGLPTYNIPAAVRLEGALDVAALGRALDEVVRRHEVLRTSYPARDGVPVQRVAAPARLDLPVEDLTPLPEADREAEALRRLRAEAVRPFDLEDGPVVRARLFRLSDRDHVAVITTHHIASDGWSIGVLIYELGALYEAFARGLPSPLPEPTIQYADYAAWQRSWLVGDVLDAQVDFWKALLAGVPSLEIPTDRPRPAVLGQRGGERSISVPKDAVDAVRALGREEGGTLFMALMAAFQTLLHRYSSQDDFAVGTPIAGRTRSEIESLIGYFVNTLVFRADLAGDPSPRDLVRRVKGAALSAYAHQDLPFDQLVTAIHPRRDPSRSPVFQAMFVLQNAPLPLESAAVDLVLTPLAPGLNAAKYDLLLDAIERDGALDVRLEYNADLFDAATADRILAHFRLLLEGMAAAPDRPAAAIPMLTDDERRRLLGGGGQADDDAGPAGADVDALSEDELDALLAQYESGPDAQDF